MTCIVAGKNLAVFRGEDGRSHVIDAYCPHMGANLAAGGIVKGSCLECPFHGWQFRGDDGKCVHIPYCERKHSKLHYTRIMKLPNFLMPLLRVKYGIQADIIRHKAPLKDNYMCW